MPENLPLEAVLSSFFDVKKKGGYQQGSVFLLSNHH